MNARSDAPPARALRQASVHRPRSAPGTEVAVPSLATALPGRFRYDGVFWRRLAYLGSAYAPEWFKRCSPAVIAAVLFAGVRSNREAVVENLRVVLGRRSEVRERLDAYRVFCEFARCVQETLEQHSPVAPQVTVDAPTGDEFAVLDRRELGLVVLTSHFGNWEVGARAMQRFARPINLVMQREQNASVEEFQRATRERMGLKVIHSDSSLFSSFSMIQALRRGEVVAMQIDRAAPGQVTKSVSFFGQPTPFQYGPFVLARLAGVPIFPVFAVRTETRHYRVLPEPPRWIERRATERDTIAVMQDVVASLEHHVRAYPHQWFQFQRFWTA